MLHDYHLYTAPGMIRDERARRLPPPLRPHPLVPARQLADPAGPDPRGDLPRHARQRHHRLPHPRLLHQLPPLLRRTARGRRRLRRGAGPPRRRPDAWPAPTRSRSTPSGCERAARVAGGGRGRARGAGAPPQAPDHPRRPRRPLEERAARLHRLRHLPHPAPGVPRSRSPSSPTCSPRARTCPSTPSTWSGSRRWSRSSTTATGPPTGCRSTCKIYENFHDAVARYKHFDLLMVNSLFDGMNLVAKEAPAVNTRDGVLMLSENTGSHEELADCAISVNPFDIQEQADAIYRALTMDPEERRVRAAAPEGDHLLAQPRRLGRRPAARHRASCASRSSGGVRRTAEGESFGAARAWVGVGGDSNPVAGSWRRSRRWPSERSWRCSCSRRCCAARSRRRWAADVGLPRASRSRAAAGSPSAEPRASAAERHRRERPQRRRLRTSITRRKVATPPLGHPSVRRPNPLPLRPRQPSRPDPGRPAARAPAAEPSRHPLTAPRSSRRADRRARRSARRYSPSPFWQHHANTSWS